MNIAIIAQNRKKELMVQFCIAYWSAAAAKESTSLPSPAAQSTSVKVKWARARCSSAAISFGA